MLKKSGKVLPEIVVYEETCTDAIGMDYCKLSPLLVEAVKSLIQQNDQLTAQNKDLQERLSNLEKIASQFYPDATNPRESGIQK